MGSEIIGGKEKKTKLCLVFVSFRKTQEGSTDESCNTIFESIYRLFDLPSFELSCEYVERMKILIEIRGDSC